MMMLRQSLGPVQRQTLETEQRLTHTQRAVIKQTLFTRRLDLIGEVHGANYQPEATCPKCSRKLTPLEIIQGFRNDANDYTTACSACNTRFEPKLVWKTTYSRGEIGFLCAMQVLAQLERFQYKTPDQIRDEEPMIYHSVRVHHGNFRLAFEKIHIQYQYENVTNWEEKVADFLGKLPDTVIAKVVDMPTTKIRDLRNSRNIPQFNRRKLLEEEEN